MFFLPIICLLSAPLAPILYYGLRDDSTGITYIRGAPHAVRAYGDSIASVGHSLCSSMKSMHNFCIPTCRFQFSRIESEKNTRFAGARTHDLVLSRSRGYSVDVRSMRRRVFDDNQARNVLVGGKNTSKAAAAAHHVHLPSPLSGSCRISIARHVGKSLHRPTPAQGLH